ncbi:hypothetical protein BH10PAT1_BH10PAT1_5220 [soil metagenome]
MSTEAINHQDILSKFNSKVTPELFKSIHSGYRGEQVIEAGYVDSGYDSIVIHINDYVVKIYDDPSMKLDTLQRYKDITNQLVEITVAKEIKVISAEREMRILVNPILWLGHNEIINYPVAISPFISGDHVAGNDRFLVESEMKKYQQVLGVSGIGIDPRNMKVLSNTSNTIVVTDLCTSIASLVRI